MVHVQINSKNCTNVIWPQSRPFFFESIDRIDLTFRLEEAVGKALDEKILFAEPDPTLAELAARLAKMIEEKK